MPPVSGLGRWWGPQGPPPLHRLALLARAPQLAVQRALPAVRPDRPAPASALGFGPWQVRQARRLVLRQSPQGRCEVARPKVLDDLLV